MRSTIAGLLLALTVWPAWPADIRVDFQTVAPTGPGEVAELEPGLGRTRIVRIDPRSLSSLRQAKRGDVVTLRIPGGTQVRFKIEGVTSGVSGVRTYNGTSDEFYSGMSTVRVREKVISGVMYIGSKIIKMDIQNDKDFIILREEYWGEGDSGNDTINPSGEGISVEDGSTKCTDCIDDMMIDKVHSRGNRSEYDYMTIRVIALVTPRVLDNHPDIIDDIYVELDNASEALFLSGIKANFVLSGIGNLRLYDESSKSLMSTLVEIPKYPTLNEYRSEKKAILLLCIEPGRESRNVVSETLSTEEANRHRIGLTPL
jgi:hypothetical protein